MDGAISIKTKLLSRAFSQILAREAGGGDRSPDCTGDHSKDEIAIVGRGQGHLLRVPRLTSSPSVPYKRKRQEENPMSAAIAYTSVYEKRVGKTLRSEERQAMELHVADKPEIHPIVSGTGVVRKARWGRRGKGKRGGVRVIYFFGQRPMWCTFSTFMKKMRKKI
jgi:hypothetical protein